MQIIDIVQEAQIEEAKERLIVASYGSWQIIETIRGLFSDKVKPIAFTDHLKRLGLAEKQQKEDPKLLERKKAAALSTAEHIKAIDRQLRKGAK